MQAEYQTGHDFTVKGWNVKTVGGEVKSAAFGNEGKDGGPEWLASSKSQIKARFLCSL